LAPHPRLGKLLLAFGVLGLIRLLPEVLQVEKHAPMYAGLATLDGVLALLTGVAGEGVRHGKRWAPKLAMRTAGVTLAGSIGMGTLLVFWLVDRQSLDEFAVGRLLYYALTIALWFYGISTLVVAVPEAGRRSLKVSFGLWFVLGFPLMAAVLVLFR
jgi:hypothetical protein